jgi:hypothetical protein
MPERLRTITENIDTNIPKIVVSDIISICNIPATIPQKPKIIMKIPTYPKG